MRGAEMGPLLRGQERAGWDAKTGDGLLSTGGHRGNIEKEFLLLRA